jgi:two-component system LytT family response regulator
MQKILIAHRTGTSFVSASEITHLQADGRYTHIYTFSGTRFTCCNTLKEFHRQVINTRQFFRVHRSYVINLGHITGISKGRRSMVKLSNQLEIPVAEQRKKALKTAIREQFSMSG